eukprot:gene13886-biopygen3770
MSTRPVIIMGGGLQGLSIASAMIRAGTDSSHIRIVDPQPKKNLEALKTTCPLVGPSLGA